MKTEIFSWTNYSCNNSSDIRLVAKFSSAKEAKAMLKKSLVFFEQHAEEHDSRIDEDDFGWPGGVTEVAKKFGKKFGHDWKEFLTWGDECLEGDEPSGVVLGDSIVFYHTYMGGYGTDFPQVLTKAGAEKVEEDHGPPTIYGELTFGGGALKDELTQMFSQREMEMYEWEFPWEIDDEIGGDEEDAVMVVEGKVARFTLPLPVIEFDGFEDYLKAGKAKKISLRIATEEDVNELKALHDAAEEEALNQGSDEETFDPSGLSFLFTGKLASMTRKEAQSRVDEIGGENAKSVTKNLDVLVIGDEGSPLYGEGSKGSKQKKADKLIEDGAAIKIISESLFLQLG